jgi:hypothetical protein
MNTSPRVELSRQQILDKTLADVYWQREWQIIDRLLEYAEQVGLESPTTASMRRSRRIPAWVYRIKDSIDSRIRRWRKPDARLHAFDVVDPSSHTLLERHRTRVK